MTHNILAYHAKVPTKNYFNWMIWTSRTFMIIEVLKHRRKRNFDLLYFFLVRSLSSFVCHLVDHIVCYLFFFSLLLFLETLNSLLYKTFNSQHLTNSNHLYFSCQPKQLCAKQINGALTTLLFFVEIFCVEFVHSGLSQRTDNKA